MQASQALRTAWRSPGCQYGLPVLLALAAFAGILRNDFTYDDYLVVGANSHLGRPGFLSALWSPRYFEVSGESTYRPLVTLAYYLVWKAGGLHPAAFHLLSLLLHAINTWLVVRLARQCRLTSTAAIAGIVFAVHPLASEAVCGVGFLEDCQVVTFGLLSLLVAAAWVVRPERDGISRALLTGAASLLFVACLAKETAVMIVGLLPLLLLLFHR